MNDYCDYNFDAWENSSFLHHFFFRSIAKYYKMEEIPYYYVPAAQRWYGDLQTSLWNIK